MFIKPQFILICVPGEKLQSSGESSMVRVRLLQEMEKYKAVLPVLKYVRGEVFAEKHWLEMYSLIGIPQSIPVERLTFGDVIKVGLLRSRQDNQRKINYTICTSKSIH